MILYTTMDDLLKQFRQLSEETDGTIIARLQARIICM